LRIIIPTDEIHAFSEGWQKTTNQLAIAKNFRRRLSRSPGIALPSRALSGGAAL